VKRKVLAEYDIRLIDQMMMITSTGMAISYALYTVAERTVKVFGTEYLIFTTVFVLFGIFRYFFLVFRKNVGENPVMVLLTDRPTFVKHDAMASVLHRTDLLEVTMDLRSLLGGREASSAVCESGRRRFRSLCVISGVG